MNTNGDGVSLAIFETHRRSQVERVNAIAFARVQQVLAELICRDGHKQHIVAVNIDADNCVRPISIPGPASYCIAVGPVVKTVIGWWRIAATVDALG